MRVDVAKIYAELERARANELGEMREGLAERYLRGIEIAVLGAMITRYDFELFADIEAGDFADWRHIAVFGALRSLELAGSHVDGEFLLADIAREVERADRELDKHLRDKVTDDFLGSLIAPPRWVVPCREPIAISGAVRQLKAAAIARTQATSAVDVVEHMARVAFDTPSGAK